MAGPWRVIGGGTLGAYVSSALTCGRALQTLWSDAVIPVTITKINILFIFYFSKSNVVLRLSERFDSGQGTAVIWVHIVNVNSLSHTRRSTRKLRTEVRREQIAQAALVLIARRGLNELNIGRLAKEVRVVPSAIYRHYPRKDAVLDSVLDLIAKSLLENVKAIREEALDSLERLHLLLQRHIRLVRDHAGIPRLIYSEQIFVGNARRRHRIHKIISSYLDEIARIVVEGQKAGTIRADVSANSAAVMFLGLVQPAIILWLISNQRFNVAQHAERAWDLFRETLATRRRFKIPAGFHRAKNSKCKQARLIKSRFNPSQSKRSL